VINTTKTPNRAVTTGMPISNVDLNMQYPPIRMESSGHIYSPI
jgi:hypothetical protein